MSLVQNCDHSLDIIESTGGTNGGEFVETWECVHCGQTGTVEGESSDPPCEWTRMGVCADE